MSINAETGNRVRPEVKDEPANLINRFGNKIRKIGFLASAKSYETRAQSYSDFEIGKRGLLFFGAGIKFMDAESYDKAVDNFELAENDLELTLAQEGTLETYQTLNMLQVILSKAYYISGKKDEAIFTRFRSYSFAEEIRETFGVEGFALSYSETE